MPHLLLIQCKRSNLANNNELHLFYKNCYYHPDDLNSLGKYDVLISGYCHDARVEVPWEKIEATRKIWIVDPNNSNLIFKSSGEDYLLNDLSEFTYVLDFPKDMGLKPNDRICIDCTGFLIPVLYVLLRSFQISGISHFDVVYSEPQRYVHAENTSFSDFYFDTRQILGYGGIHTSDMQNDLLIVASGYDDKRISDIANYKKSVKKKIQMLGFPPLQADMFQENIVKAYNSEPALGSHCFDMGNSNIFAPAYDPFVAAQNIKEYLEERQLKKPFTNIYFSPLSSKPLALGIALFYIWEQGHTQSMSVIYPQCKNYITENSEGIGCIWQYEFVLPVYKY